MNRPTVYLIDDEPELVELLSDVVKLCGLEVQGYTSAHRFFEQVERFERGSILVLDLHMPDIDGIEVMRRLAELDNPPAIILASGRDAGVRHSAEELGRARGLNIITSLGKPVQIEQFQQLIEQHAVSTNSKPKVSAPVAEHDPTADELLQGIRNDQMILHYQPQCDISSGLLTGVEALVRWHHPELGLIYPNQFIALAEQNACMGELTRWVIDKAVEQEREWQHAGLEVTVSVNISAGDITSLTLPEQLAGLLADSRLDPTRLTLEVTESVLMGELVTSLDILTRLRLKGIGLSIDDFGTGYSSLSQLHRLPFTELKIDRSFVANMTVDHDAHAIVKTCIMLGHELNMLVVAEGVETEAQIEQLKILGCDKVQGDIFSRPVEAAEITKLHKLTQQLAE